MTYSERMIDRVSSFDAKLIGSKVKELRKAQKMTQMELSKRAKVSQSVISKLERGNIIDIGVISLTKIGLALDLRLTPWWL